ncbi:MAG: hypothetical protein ACRDQA_30480, partial [Nocardioidaceae bacterium]
SHSPTRVRGESRMVTSRSMHVTDVIRTRGSKSVVPAQDGECHCTGDEYCSQSLSTTSSVLARRKEAARQQVLLTASPRIRDRIFPAGTLVLQQPVQHADCGVERRPGRPVLGLTVSPSIVELLAEQPCDDAHHPPWLPAVVRSHFLRPPDHDRRAVIPSMLRNG